MAEQVVDLGSGLALYKVHVDEAREQDVNARSMSKQMFDRLQATLARDRRLESLPLCALRQNGRIEIISGHHRFRAARAAGLNEIYVLMDVSGLTDDQIRAKQLAHNAIQGEDDAQLVKKIYESIADVNQRLETFIDSKALDIKFEKIDVSDISASTEYRTALVAFMPYEEARFEAACIAVETQLGKDVPTAYLNDIRWMERWKQILARTGREYDIRAAGTIFAKIGDIVLEHLGEAPKGQDEWVPIRDIVGSAYMPREAAAVLQAAVDRMIATNQVGRKNRWQVLEYLAAEYLGAPADPDSVGDVPGA